MAIETELKLRIEPKHLSLLKSHPFLRSLSIGRASTRKFYSIYFDTPDLHLHHQRMALRLRRVGSQWLQTLKGGGGVKTGLHQRNEWETTVASEQLDFVALEKIGAIHLSHRLHKEAKPMFITDFMRSTRIVKFEGALIELSLDNGEIRAGKFRHPISELELELKSGEPLQLFRLALALLEIVPLEIEVVSKAEYGYRLHAPIEPIVSKAKNTKFSTHASVDEVLQSMIWSCLFHLQANVAGVVNKMDDEFLHQVRVALRRLRVALRMTAKYCADAELESLCFQIAELGRALGRSREWDVFVAEVLAPVLKNAEGYAGQATLVSKSEFYRQESHLLVQSVLSSTDFQRLLLNFGAWMTGGYWKKFCETEKLQNFSELTLHGLRQKILRRGESIEGQISNKQLHKLRIACKNLRYCTELFGLANSNSSLNILVKLQDKLGRLHDYEIALHLLEELENGSELEIFELIRRMIVRNKSNQLKATRKEWKKFIAQQN